MSQAIAQRWSRIQLNPGLILASAAVIVIAAGTFIAQQYVSISPDILASLGYPIIFLVNVLGSLTIFLPVPGLAVVFAGGSTLHPMLVAIVAGAGMALGMIGSYVVGLSAKKAFRGSGSGSSGLFGTSKAKIAKWFRHYGILAAFLLAAVPNPFFDFAGLIAASVRMPLWKFLLGTFAGKTLQALVVALAGFYSVGWLVG